MDIDTDFSAHARAISIQYVKERYGERAVANIMTKGKIAAKKALEYAPKLLGLEKYGDKKHYISLYKDMRKFIGDEPNAVLSDYEKLIRDTFSKNPDAIKILDYALLIEGYIASYATHAAGVIITDGSDVENYIPLMKAKDDDGNEVYAVQADMVQCEAQLGFIKMDFLGLKNLKIITDCMHLITDNYGIKIDPYHLPFEPEVFEKIYASGNTNFVFQFESDGMKKMLKQFHPKTFDDIILLVACYRPGPMSFIPDIIRSKETGEKSEIVARIPILEPVLKETYGYPVYQEEVMKIMTTCASFSMGEADNVRRHMSKKHEDELAKIRPDFVAGCAKNGISEEDANWLYDKLMPFAKYGFNKSHAAAYSLVSYMTAWLKFHYPAEYLSAAMGTQGEKTAQFVEDCTTYNFTIYGPDINKSQADFIPYEDGIIVGLKAVKGAKQAAELITEERKLNGEFKSLEDFAERVKIKSNELEKYVLAGACDNFTNNRKIAGEQIRDYKDIYNDLSDLRSTVDEKSGLVEQLKTQIESTELNDENTKEIKKIQNSIKSAEKAIKEKSDKINETEKILSTIITTNNIPLENSQKLAYEAELLGMWISGNPLADYNTDGFKTVTDLEELNIGKSVKFAGIVSSSKVIQTKSGQKMAFLKANDRDGRIIDLIVFPMTYDSCKNLCEKGTAIQVAGKTDSNDDGSVQLIAEDIRRLSPKTKTLFISVNDIVQLCDLYDILLQNRLNDGGILCKVYNKELKEINKILFKVDPMVINELTEKGYEAEMKNIHFTAA